MTTLRVAGAIYLALGIGFGWRRLPEQVTEIKKVLLCR